MTSAREKHDLSHHFDGEPMQNWNCRMGFHDGPKVAMWGDPLVNGVRVFSKIEMPVNGRATLLLEVGSPNAARRLSFKPRSSRFVIEGK